MKAILVLSYLAATMSVALAQGENSGPVLVDPDFGLTFATPEGSDAEMNGQTPEGLVSITVSTPMARSCSTSSFRPRTRMGVQRGMERLSLFRR